MTTAHLKATIYERLGLTSEQLVGFSVGVASLKENRHQVAELALFGSILRNDFHSGSDVDILVTYEPSAQRGLLEKFL